MSQANVRSLDSIKDFRVALINFSEDAKNALTGVEMEIRHFRNWLERDRLGYWKGQVKKNMEAVAEAKADLFRRQLSQSNSESVSDADQKEALRLAKRRLKEAEDKVEKIKKMIPVLEHAIAEYHSQSQPLGDRLSGGLVGSIMLLERMIIAVERYLALEAPTSQVLQPTEPDSGSSGTRGGKAGSAANGSPAEAADKTTAPAAASTQAAPATKTAPTEEDDEAPMTTGRPEPASARPN